MSEMEALPSPLFISPRLALFPHPLPPFHSLLQHLLFRTLRENKWVAKNLKTISISHNLIEDSAGELVLFLREASSLTKLEVRYSLSSPPLPPLPVSPHYSPSSPLLTHLSSVIQIQLGLPRKQPLPAGVIPSESLSHRSLHVRFSLPFQTWFVSS